MAGERAVLEQEVASRWVRNPACRIAEGGTVPGGAYSPSELRATQRLGPPMQLPDVKHVGANRPERILQVAAAGMDGDSGLHDHRVNCLAGRDDEAGLLDDSTTL